MKRPSLPFLAFTGCGLIWGSTFLVIRVGNDALPALWACSLRFFLAAILLTAIMLVTRQPWPKGAAFKAAVGYGVLEFGLSMSFLYWGERVVSSGLAAVLYAICPVVAIISAKIMGMEELNPKRLLGAVVAFLGVGVIFWRELFFGGSPMGLAAIFFAAVAAPIAGLVLQRVPPQNAIGVNAVGLWIGGLPLTLLGSFLLGEKQVLPTTFREIFPVVYLAVMGSMVAFVMFAWLIQKWRATTVAFLGVIVPVIAVILGAVIRHETFAAGSLAGAAVVLVGVAIALRSDNARQDVPGEKVVEVEREAELAGV